MESQTSYSYPKLKLVTNYEHVRLSPNFAMLINVLFRFQHGGASRPLQALLAFKPQPLTANLAIN